jgi:hypothetical protein
MFYRHQCLLKSDVTLPSQESKSSNWCVLQGKAGRQLQVFQQRLSDLLFASKQQQMLKLMLFSWHQQAAQLKRLRAAQECWEQRLLCRCWDTLQKLVQQRRQV